MFVAISHRAECGDLVGGPDYLVHPRRRAILGGTGGIIGVEYSELLGWISPLWTLLSVVRLAVLLRGLRRSWDATTIEYLEQAVRLNLRLPGMLRGAEAEKRRFVRKRIRRLRGQIEEGASIGDSLSRRQSPDLWHGCGV